MLFFENLVSSIGSYISSESIVSSINSVVLHIPCNPGCAVFLSAAKETKGRNTSPRCRRDSAEARICDGFVSLPSSSMQRQMEVVQEENKRKEAEIDLLKKQVRSSAPKPKPTPPPFPPELERYTQRSERCQEEVPQTIPSPTRVPDVLQYEEVSIETSFSTSDKPSLKPAHPPPLPFLNDIQDPATKHRLRKVQKCDRKAS